MPLTADYKHQIGEITLSQMINGKKVQFKFGIFQSNAFAAIVYRGKEKSTLYNFVGGKEHADNMIKNKVHFFGDAEVHEIKLNSAYKESSVLINFFTRLGYEVKSYYDKPRNK